MPLTNTSHFGDPFGSGRPQTRLLPRDLRVPMTIKRSRLNKNDKPLIPV